MGTPIRIHPVGKNPTGTPERGHLYESIYMRIIKGFIYTSVTVSQLATIKIYGERGSVTSDEMFSYVYTSIYGYGETTRKRKNSRKKG